MTKASKLVAQLEEQASQMEARLRKKDERLKTLAGHIEELKAQLRKMKKSAFKTWQTGTPEEEENIVAWAGPIPMPKEAGGMILDEMLKNYSERSHRYGPHHKVTMEKWQFHQVCREILGLMERVRALEAENADLRNQLRDALERC